MRWRRARRLTLEGRRKSADRRIMSFAGSRAAESRPGVVAVVLVVVVVVESRVEKSAVASSV